MAGDDGVTVIGVMEMGRNGGANNYDESEIPVVTRSKL